MLNLQERLRRNRKSENMRRLVSETHLDVSDLIYPIFIKEGEGGKEGIKTMPGTYRWSIDRLPEICDKIIEYGIPGIALFPIIEKSKKTTEAQESYHSNGLIPKAIQFLKKRYPNLLLISDIALDPYSSDGHDGLVKDGEILNDESIEVLKKMALCHAESGVDIVAPSDMMDGRVGEIRKHLDHYGYQNISILAYSVKYASALYGPFRDALDSEPKVGDKKTYQMDIKNRLEARREAEFDLREGADMIMVKPAGMYLDVIRELRDRLDCPIAAYQVSGEYAMIKAAGEKKMIDSDQVMIESLIALKRAGANFILTYGAVDVALQLKEG